MIVVNSGHTHFLRSFGSLAWYIVVVYALQLVVPIPSGDWESKILEIMCALHLLCPVYSLNIVTCS